MQQAPPQGGLIQDSSNATVQMYSGTSQEPLNEHHSRNNGTSEVHPKEEPVTERSASGRRALSPNANSESRPSKRMRLASIVSATVPIVSRDNTVKREASEEPAGNNFNASPSHELARHMSDKTSAQEQTEQREFWHTPQRPAPFRHVKEESPIHDYQTHLRPHFPPTSLAPTSSNCPISVPAISLHQPPHPTADGEEQTSVGLFESEMEQEMSGPNACGNLHPTTALVPGARPDVGPSNPLTPKNKKPNRPRRRGKPHPHLQLDPVIPTAPLNRRSIPP